jgi:hypothetical protein
MKMPSTADNAPPLLRRINFLWYAVALLPILAALWYSLIGVLPPLVAVFAFFALVFWFFSLLFALWERFVKKRGIGQ